MIVTDSREGHFTRFEAQAIVRLSEEETLFDACTFPSWEEAKLGAIAQAIWLLGYRNRIRKVEL